VDALVDRAIAAGGTAGDTEDHGFMYGRSYDDPDGHSWQIFWMAREAAEVGHQAVLGAAETARQASRELQRRWPLANVMEPHTESIPSS
jgi:hypothetical protein